MSGVRCKVSGVYIYFFSDKLVELVGGGSVINGAYPSSSPTSTGLKLNSTFNLLTTYTNGIICFSSV